MNELMIYYFAYGFSLSLALTGPYIFHLKKRLKQETAEKVKLIDDKEKLWLKLRDRLDNQGRAFLEETESLKEAHKQELEKLEKAPAKSLELSEFLQDIARYGYSYARVRPADIMIRSPRDRN